MVSSSSDSLVNISALYLCSLTQPEFEVSISYLDFDQSLHLGKKYGLLGHGDFLQQLVKEGLQPPVRYFVREKYLARTIMNSCFDRRHGSPSLRVVGSRSRKLTSSDLFFGWLRTSSPCDLLLGVQIPVVVRCNAHLHGLTTPIYESSGPESQRTTPSLSLPPEESARQ